MIGLHEPLDGVAACFYSWWSYCCSTVLTLLFLMQQPLNPHRFS